MTKGLFRLCLKCRKILPLPKFEKSIETQSGWHYRCKPCMQDHYKKCSKCKRIKSKHFFYREKKTATKTSSACRECLRGIKQDDSTYSARNMLDRRERVKKYNRKMRREDPLFKVRASMRSRMSVALKLTRWNKTSKFAEYIGCTLTELRAHFESHFLEGMSWENYGRGIGKWGIDHIVAISHAQTPDELYKLNHYTNLRPLWHEENSRKGNRNL